MNPMALHRLLVGFTVSLVAVSVLSELLAFLLKRQSLRATAAWTLGYAAAITPLTAISGYLLWDSLFYSEQLRAMRHLSLGIGLAAALVPLAVWRGWLQHRDSPPGFFYILIAGLVYGGSVFQSNMGRNAVVEKEDAAAQLAGEVCRAHSTPGDESSVAPSTAPSAPTTAPVQILYACPMHPDVFSSRPGNCPKCGMRLVEKTP